jgi:capsular polysaccharide biosynthesis protein
MITNHVWGLTHLRKHKPNKTHNLWKKWEDDIEINLPPVTKHFNETYTYVWLPIDEESANNPWHVWIDIISKFRLIEKRWSTVFSKYIFVLPNHSEYFDKVVKEFFTDLKYMIMPKNEVWQFKHLIVPSMSNHLDGIITPHLAPWIRVLKNILKVGSTQKRKLFVTRNGAKTRKLLNAEKLMIALKGWETITLEELPIREQVRCFSEASHVVSTHGAGLTNLLWCEPGTNVIEIQDPGMLHKKVYPVLSHHLRLKHEVYLGTVVPIAGKKPKGVKRKNDLINLTVNVGDLIRHID